MEKVIVFHAGSFPGRITTISNQGFFAELSVDAAGVIFNTVMLTSSLVAMNFRQGGIAGAASSRDK